MSVGPLIVSVSGTTLTKDEITLLSHPKVGGLVLFKENFDENSDNPKAKLIELIKEIRSINPNIIIMVDHEGGRVWRFKKGFTVLNAAESYGKLYDENDVLALKKAEEDGFIMAQELLNCKTEAMQRGIDMSLAPVVDLGGESSVIGKYQRAFHSDPKIVAKLSECFIQGMNRAGMIATLKHFPGHGTCKADSHTHLPIDERPWEALLNDLYPFEALLKKDLSFAIMSNFVKYPDADPYNVAAFSEFFLKMFIRKLSRFQGIIMSDCLHMEGANVGDQLERLSRALEAGNNFLMYTHQHDIKEKNIFKLKALLSILDQIPDNEESQKRRSEFLSRLIAMQQNKTAPSLLPDHARNSAAYPSLAAATVGAGAGAGVILNVNTSEINTEINEDAGAGRSANDNYSVL